jgi:hypothetical protein
VSDIDSARMTLRIEQGKGAKDRVALWNMGALIGDLYQGALPVWDNIGWFTLGLLRVRNKSLEGRWLCV